MKKLITILCLVLALSSALPVANAETDSAAMEQLMTLLDHCGELNDWKGTLNEWFAPYKTRVDKGETLSDSEMEVIFAYTNLAVDMMYVFIAESGLLGDGDDNTDTDLKEIVDQLQSFYEAGYLTQPKYFENIAVVFDRLVTK